MTDHVEGFDTFEEMLDAIEARRDAANATLAPEQEALTWGSRFVVFLPEYDEIQYGYVLTEDENIKSLRDSGSTRSELREAVKQTRTMLDQGYMFSRSYSVQEPDGMLGDVHKASAWPMPEALFEEIKAVRWDTNQMPPDLLAKLDALYQTRRAHALRVADGWQRS